MPELRTDRELSWDLIEDAFSQPEDQPETLTEAIDLQSMKLLGSIALSLHHLAWPVEPETDQTRPDAKDAAEAPAPGEPGSPGSPILRIPF